MLLTNFNSYLPDDFSLTKSFRPHYGPGVDSDSYRNEYQEHFLGGKGGRLVGLTTLHFHVSTVLYSGSLNFLEPSGPVQACNGIALPIPLPNLSHSFVTLHNQSASPPCHQAKHKSQNQFCSVRCIKRCLTQPGATNCRLHNALAIPNKCSTITFPNIPPPPKIEPTYKLKHAVTSSRV
jgi:hypothetical protein